jgi:hypothetical protein
LSEFDAFHGHWFFLQFSEYPPGRQAVNWVVGQFEFALI